MQNAMPDANGGSSAAWKTVTWDGNRDALLDSTLAATPAQRLAWLEDAIEIAYRAGASSNRATGKDKKRVEKPAKPSNFS